MVEEFDRVARIVKLRDIANSDIEYIDVKGKEYAEVKERIAAFRKVYPEGGILATIKELDDKHCVVECSIIDENGRVLALAHAHETISASVINRSSMLENCETSAVGRALGFLGFGIKTAVASSLEAQRAYNIADKRNGLQVCHRCGREIIDTADKKGKVWKAQEIAQMTMKHFGDTLCLPCVADIKATTIEAEG